MKSKYVSLSLAAATLLMAPSCATRPPFARVEQAPSLVMSDPPEFLQDDIDAPSFANAAAESKKYLAANNGASIRFGSRTVTSEDIAGSIDRLAQIVADVKDPAARKKLIAAEFDFYSINTGRERGAALVTGYYQPALRASRTKTDAYKYPVYRRPDDLVNVDLGLFDDRLKGKRISGRVEVQSLLPYYDRRNIDRENKLEGRGLEIVWVDDPVALFFLHVQGSGIVELDGGSRIFVNFAAGNGRDYKSIGKALIAEGAIGENEMSLQAIRSWLAAHTDQMERILDSNPSYVFFREMDDGPYGSTGARLVAGRSAAFDPAYFPSGAVAYVVFDAPVVADGQVTGWEKTGRFVFSHDKGAAIKGPGRMDLFMGAGPEAEAAAGVMKQKGSLFFPLMKKTGGQ